MIARVLWLTLVLAAPAAAQTVSPGLEHANPEMLEPARREVRQRVELFLQKLGSRDVAAVREMLTPKALVAVARRERDGTWTTSYETGEELLARLAKGGQPFREPLANVVVTIDSERLAYVRADFTIVRDGAVVSSGVDHFTLLREPGGWKVAALAYTSIPAKP